ncbi:MAG: MATE family efflux transporter [Planctomycetaceae bacterium]
MNSLDHKSRPAAPPGSFRELLVVALPLIASSGSLSLMHVVDRILLARFNVDALAASTPAGLLHWMLMSFPFGFCMYAITFVSQYDGAGRKDRVAASVWQALFVAVASGVLLAVMIPLTSQIPEHLGHSDTVVQLEQQYFSVLSFGSIPMLVSAVLSAYYSGRGHTKVVLFANVLASLCNLAGDAVLIFGWGPFPMLGIAGAAWGTVLANIVAVLFYIGWLCWSGDSVGYPFKEQFRFDAKLLKRMLYYGFPNGTQYLVDVAAYFTLLAVIGRIGTIELASTAMAFNLNSLAFIPLFGIGTAVSTLVGRRVGEGVPILARRTTWIAFATGAVYMMLWNVVYLFLPETIISLYDRGAEAGSTAAAASVSFAEIREVTTILLRFVVVYSLFDAMLVIFGSAIRGAGDTRFSLLFTTIGLWGLMVLPVWWGSYHGWGVYACWIALCVQVGVLGVGFLIRFSRGAWMSMRVIEHAEEGAEVPALLELPMAATALSAVGAVHGTEDQNVQTVVLDEPMTTVGSPDEPQSK